MNSKVRKTLRIPKSATYKVKSYKFYWDGGGLYMRHVEVTGTGKCKKYFVSADFTLDYLDAKSIFPWNK